MPAGMWQATHMAEPARDAHRLPTNCQAVAAEVAINAKCLSCTCRRRALPEHCRSDFSAATRMAAAASAGLGPGTAPCCEPCSRVRPALRRA